MDAATAQTELAAIETALDTGEYKPGPWAAFLRGARRLPAAERRELAEDVSRVSDKLHGRSPRRKLPVALALALATEDDTEVYRFAQESVKIG